MQISDDAAVRPPQPACARTWPDFTAALRELFAWCGRPKYSTVSKTSGLAPSNISNLIGKNPLQRPSQAAAMRFVEACLTIGGYSPRAVQDSVEEWRQAWTTIETADLVPVEASPAARQSEAAPFERVMPSADRPRRGVGSLVLAAGAGALSVVVAGAAWVAWNAEANADQKPPSKGMLDNASGATKSANPANPANAASAANAANTADATSTLARCQPSRISPIDDVRTKRSWSDVLVCPNDVGAEIRLEPTLTSSVVGTLDYDSSWFVCWATGAEHAGHNRIWYYTKGDSMVAHPEAQKWGYVSASDLNIDQDPDPHAIRECPQ